MADDLESLVALNLTGLVGAVLHRRLVDRFGSAREALRAPPARLREIQGIGPVTADAIVSVGRSGAAGRELELASKRDVEILPLEGPGYPPPLRVLYDPPLVLYRKGEYGPADALAVGVVGSRQCSAYGERQAGRFAAELASLGVTVVSGLARGVDAAAHGGALRTETGRTIAVLGSGLLRIYPPEHERLFDRACARGCAFSEFGLTAGPEPANFPRRNRLISGLSLGVLVVEAQEKSGALITADWAMEQGREVFCLPGSIENPMSRGPHLLIKQGAKLAESAMDILEELPALASIVEKVGRPVSLSPLERTLLSHLDDRPRTSESVAARSKLPECSVSSALPALLAKGLIRASGDGFVRATSLRSGSPRSPDPPPE